MKSSQVNELSRRAAAGFSWLFSGAVIQSLSAILVLSVLARLIEPIEFGRFGSAMIIVGLFQLISRTGMGAAIIHFEDITNNLEYTANFLTLINGTFMMLILFIFADNISQMLSIAGGADLIKILSVSCILAAISEIPTAILMRQLNYKLIARIRLTSFIFGYGLPSILMAFLDFGVWALVGGILGQLFLTAALLLSVTKMVWLFKILSSDVKNLIRYSTGITVTNIVNYIATQADNFIIAKYLGANALGIYGRAYSILMTPVSVLGTTLDTTIFPALARINQNTDLQSKVIFNLTYATVLVILPVSVVMVISAEEIVLVVLGPNWLEVIPVFQILALSMAFRSGYKVFDSYCKATGKVYELAIRHKLYMILVVAGCFIGKNYGLMGVAYAITTANILHYAAMAQLSFRNSHYTIFDFLKIYISVGTILLPAANVGYQVRKFLIHSNYGLFTTLTLTLMAYSAILVICLFVCRKFLPNDLRIFISQRINFDIKKIKI